METVTQMNDGYGLCLKNNTSIKVMRKCRGKRGCGLDKDISEFVKSSILCKECRTKYDTQQYQKHKTSKCAHQKIYSVGRKEEIDKYNDIYYKEHRTNILAQKKEYHDAHKKEQSDWQRAHRDEINARYQIRMKEDIDFRIAVTLRKRLRDALSGIKKIGSAVKDLGCSIGHLI